MVVGNNEEEEEGEKVIETRISVNMNKQPIRMLGPTLPQKLKNQRVKMETETYAVNDPDDYVEWFPPSDQAGDGITSLNAKYGY
uniref:SJCHGC09745 protein n=1 Tax=Schistosoma japonicum TaxID=6182 RepID=Q5BQZ8_SCHJA|nr:SJCHGC09745 protein [Schistosoma japonicum]